MTVLITGATGLVGTRLLPRLLAAGIECRALVRAGKEVPDGVTPVTGDIVDAASLDGALEGVTTVVHLAAVFRTPNEDAIRQVNVDGTRNLIAATRAQAPQARFVMASTGLVYGAGPRTHPANESDGTPATAPYPASKLVAEADLTASGLTWSILRFGFVYGDQDGHLEIAPQLYTSLKAHPAQSVSLVHHRDIAGAVRLAITGAFDDRIVNIVDEAPVTVGEIATLLGADYATSSEPLVNPWQGRVDTTLARSLGFQASVPTLHQAQREAIL